MNMIWNVLSTEDNKNCFYIVPYMIVSIEDCSTLKVMYNLLSTADRLACMQPHLRE